MKKGRVVLKGQTACGYLLDGTAIFAKRQTKPKPKKELGGYDSWYMGDGEEYY